ncbi:MAG TPA: hypothetical protein VLE19_15155 [Pyrinomonadaceae bacterium]|nr:hypothetical protein [Pyrinomonadaceae bacterium]
MNKRLPIAIALMFYLVNLSPTFGKGSLLTFPVDDGTLSALPGFAASLFGGRVGLVLSISGSPRSVKLFSFSLVEGAIVDQVDLEADFGESTSPFVPLANLKVNESGGLVLVYGQHADGTQRLVAFRAALDGHLQRLWSVLLPVNALIAAGSDLAISTDGSRIAWIYYLPTSSQATLRALEMRQVDEFAELPKERPVLVRALPSQTSGFWNAGDLLQDAQAPFERHLGLIRAEDGVQLDSVELSAATIFASVYFDDIQNRIVALADQIAYVFEHGLDALAIQRTINAETIAPDLTGVGVSANGRFLVAYGGYLIGTSSNVYVTFDLELGNFSELDLNEPLSPISNGFTFHPRTGVVFAPLLAAFQAGPSSGGSFRIGGTREGDILALSPDGTLSRTANFKIPKQSNRDNEENALSGYSNVEVSETGTLAFIPSRNGHLFTFDALSGEIIGDKIISSELKSILLIEASNRFLASDFSSNRILVLESETAPVIFSIKVKKHKTLVNGENFLSGAQIRIDGGSLGVATRSEENPGGQIVLSLGKKDFPRGRDFSFIVTNRDGRDSKPFTLHR